MQSPKAEHWLQAGCILCTCEQQTPERVAVDMQMVRVTRKPFLRNNQGVDGGCKYVGDWDHSDNAADRIRKRQTQLPVSAWM